MGIHLLSSSAICAKDEKPIFFAIDVARTGVVESALEEHLRGHLEIWTEEKDDLDGEEGCAAAAD